VEIEKAKFRGVPYLRDNQLEAGTRVSWKQVLNMVLGSGSSGWVGSYMKRESNLKKSGDEVY